LKISKNELFILAQGQPTFRVWTPFSGTQQPAVALAGFGLLVLLVIAPLRTARAAITVQFANGTQIQLLSYPQQYGSNSRNFSTVAGIYGGRPFAGEPVAGPGLILALEYRGWRAPYAEAIFSEWKTKYNPLAVIYYNTNDSQFWADGFPGASKSICLPFKNISMSLSFSCVQNGFILALRLRVSTTPSSM
jgi:hypothetical protein